MSVRLPNPMSAVIWLSFFVPTSLFGGWLDRSLGVAVFLLGCAVLPSKPSPWEARKPSVRAIKFFVLLEFLYVVSTLYSAAFNGIQIGPLGCFELLRYVFLGVFVVYLIRHFDAPLLGAMEWAMTAAVYYFLLFPSADAQGYISLLTLCWLIFFSRLRLRFLHAATAALVVFLSGDRGSWMAAVLVLSAAVSVPLYRSLVRRRVGYAAQLSLLFCCLLFAGSVICVRATRLAAPAWSSSSEDAALQFIRRSPVFGWGPAENAAAPGRSQYLRWTLEGGALGMGLILAGLVLAGYSLLRAVSGDLTRFAGAAACLASVALMLSTGRYFESFRFFFLTAFFMAAMRVSKNDGH